MPKCNKSYSLSPFFYLSQIYKPIKIKQIIQENLANSDFCAAYTKGYLDFEIHLYKNLITI